MARGNGAGSAPTLEKILAARAGVPVLIVPKARDANAVNALDKSLVAIPATAAYGHCEQLAGRAVSIWHVTEADTHHFAEELLKIGVTPSVIDDDGELTSIAQWLAEGATAAQFHQYARSNVLRAAHKALPAPIAPTPAPPLQGTPEKAATTPARELPPLESDRDVWRHYSLELNGSGNPYTSLHNILKVLALHPKTRERFCFDQFRDCVLIDGKPWRADESGGALTALLQDSVRFQTIKSGQVIEAVETFARRAQVHAVRDWLLSIAPWDGRERLAQLLALGFGAEAGPYSGAVGTFALMSAVARVFEPGCFVKMMLVLEGKQDIGKSSGIKLLAGEWYLDCTTKLDSKDFYQEIQGRWIVELSEVAAMMKAGVEEMKAALSRRDDVYRASYGRRAAAHPRQCIFIGTTNRTDWLADESGGSRFLPVNCSKVDLAWIARERAQLWAEALHRYRAVARWEQYAPPIPMESLAEQREARYVPDAWEEMLRSYCASRPHVIIEQFMEDALRLEPRDMTQHNKLRVVRILTQRLGWHQKRIYLSSQQVRVYVP